MSKMAMRAEQIGLSSDLETLVTDINNAEWDEANEMSSFDVESLTAYLERPDTVFIVCRESSANGDLLLGIASARIEMKPTEKMLWLYIDEVDVCADQRERGAGKLIMQTLLSIAEEKGCEEVWLGAYKGNLPANALYRSLGPDDISEVIGYTYEIE